MRCFLFAAVIAAAIGVASTAEAHAPDRVIDACVTYSRTATVCLRDDPLGRQYGDPFFFRGRVERGHPAGVTVWRMRPHGTQWRQVGSAPVNANNRFQWVWNTTLANASSGYYRFQFRSRLGHSNTLRARVYVDKSTDP